MRNSKPSKRPGKEVTALAYQHARTKSRAARTSRPTGAAKTREVKLAVAGSAQTADNDGCPVPDPGCATCNAAIESIATRDTDTEPAPSVRHILREAERRGFDKAARRIVLGDGAPWLWDLADEHFPDATRIVDIFHAKGHLLEVAKTIYGHGSEISGRWTRMRREVLDEGRVDEVLAALRSHAGTCGEARKNVDYFSSNRERMNSPEFQAMGLCVATGVVEGGGKHIVGARLKHGGMRWTVPGANAIIALCCAIESHRFDDFRERRTSAKS